MVNSGERRCITIQILDDSVVERQEYLRVRLTARPFPVQHRSCYIYITDNDSKCHQFAYLSQATPAHNAPAHLQALGLLCLPLFTASMEQLEVYIASRVYPSVLH